MLSKLFRRKTDFQLTEEGSHSLHKVLSVRDLTLFGIAAIIGAGIFTSVGKACASGGPAVIWLFIICAVACAFAALCYAEFASRIPVSGSAYTYAYATFGELFAWVIGWALLMEYAIGNIYVAFSWSGYFTHLLDGFGLYLPRWMVVDYSSAHKFILAKQGLIDAAMAQGNSGALWIAANCNDAEKELVVAWTTAPNLIGGLKLILDVPALVINILITVLVYRGIKESRNASNAMVILKILAVVMVIAVGAFYIDFENFKPFMPKGFKGVMASVSAVFFTYIGFDAISTLAEESQNPKRDLPRGMFYSLIICTVLYVLVSLVLTGMVPFINLGVDDPLAYALQVKNVKWLEYIVSIIAVVAMASVLLVFQLGQPRIWLSMSRDGLLPSAFSKIHPKNKTPSFSTIITGLAVGVPIIFTNEDFVLDFTSIGTLFAFVLVCGGVLLLPKRELNGDDGFVLPHVHGKFLFPLLVALSATIIYFSVPSYFDDVFDLSKSETFTSFNLPHIIFWLFLICLSVLTFLKNFNLIPLMGLATCGYLLTGMNPNNWYWFFVWFAIGLVIYFVYGYRNSVLNKK